MNIYIWKNVAGVTENWHNSAGVAIVAASEHRARELLFESAGDDERGPFTEPVDACFELVGEVPEAVFIFPDAGCC